VDAKPRPAQVRIKPIDREQSCWRTVIVDELIPVDHAARAIWEQVCKLDLSGFYATIKAVKGVPGRDHLDPRLMTALWIYGYSEGISSAREIARRCAYQPAFQWLCGLETVSYHALSSFRVDHGARLEQLFVNHLTVLSSEGLIDLSEVMHDGTKIEAQASSGSFRRAPTLKEHRAAAERRVQELAAEAEADGGGSGEGLSARQKAARARAAREKNERMQQALKEFEAQQAAKRPAQRDEVRISETEPEARIMKHANGGFAPSYNVQVSTEASSTIIVAIAATPSGGDPTELVPAVARIEANFEQKPGTMVVDGGFATRGNVVALAAQEIELVGALIDHSQPAEKGLERRGVTPEYYPSQFQYQEETDAFQCPEGKLLQLKRTRSIPGATEYHYRANWAQCGNCPAQPFCCPIKQKKKPGRVIIRRVEDDAVLAYRERMETEAAQALYHRRSEVAEFPNLWIKEKIGLRKFCLRGLAKANIETLWVALTYNLQQWIRLRWRPRLAAAAVVAAATG
jgi:transposase